LNIKKLVLELGGSDPFIVLKDADVERAAQVALQSRFINSGQSCIAAKRLIVASEVSKEFLDRFLAAFRAMRVGDPMVEGNYIGPMAKRESLKALDRQLTDARDKGADIILGHEPPAGKGYFFQPAVVINVAPDMKVLTDEVFGPIAPIIVAVDEEEIIKVANASEFGLGASIWSNDIDRAVRLSKRIDAGFVAINDMVKSDPRLPFGGIKKSGVGRELSHYGLKEFSNIKTVVIQK
jgi:succinate-semialdehyde dehydrogenase/glutarate-semialdehyde dehydrogenase